MSLLRYFIIVSLLFWSSTTVSLAAPTDVAHPTAADERPAIGAATPRREEGRRGSAEGEAPRPPSERRRERQSSRPAEPRSATREMREARTEPAASRRMRERAGDGAGSAQIEGARPGSGTDVRTSPAIAPPQPTGGGGVIAPGPEGAGGAPGHPAGGGAAQDGAVGQGAGDGRGAEEPAAGGSALSEDARGGEGAPGESGTGEQPATLSPAEDPAGRAGAVAGKTGAVETETDSSRASTQAGERSSPDARRPNASAPEAKSEARPERKPNAAAPVLRVDREAWRQLFERQPLGFTRQTPQQMASEVAGWFTEAGKDPRQALAPVLVLGWGFWLGCSLLAALLVLGAVVERKRPRWWRRPWTTARALGRSSQPWKWGITVMERSAAPLTALIAWSLGGLLAGTESMPFILIQSILAAWCGYRLLDQGLALVAGRYPIGMPARDLYEQFHRLLLFALVWGCGWIALELLDVRDDFSALWVTAGHLCLVLGLFTLLANRQRVLSVLPLPEAGYFGLLRRAFLAAYFPLVYASLVISVLWAVGYQQLASVALGRSWAIIAVLGLIALVGRTGERLLVRWLRDEEGELPGEGAEAYRCAQRLWGLLLVLVAIGLMLRALGLGPAIQYVLGLTWVQLGSIEITGRAVLRTILIILFGLRLSGFLQSMLSYRVYPRTGIAEGEAYALNRLLHYTLIAVSALLVLNNLGLSAESLAIVLGGLSVGIGFGLQNIANNVASGIILLTSRQVRRGDLVTVGEHTGNVQEVSLRSTRVTTFDNVDVLIPNSKLLDDTLVNWTHSGTVIRGMVTFDVAYGSNPKQVLQLVGDIAIRHPDVLEDPASDVRFVSMTDHSLTFELYFWVDMKQASRPKVTTELFCQIYDVLNDHGIKFPFPQRDLHVRSGVPWAELLEAIRGKADGTVPGNGKGKTPRTDQVDGASTARVSSEN